MAGQDLRLAQQWDREDRLEEASLRGSVQGRPEKSEMLSQFMYPELFARVARDRLETPERRFIMPISGGSWE
jgi:hypothetical protein